MCKSPIYLLNPSLKSISLCRQFSALKFGDVEYSWSTPVDFIHLREFYKTALRLNLIGCKSYSDIGFDTINSAYVVDTCGTKHNLIFSAPCGKCKDCIYRKKREICNRALLEYASTGIKPIFFTLTYDDAHLPEYGVSREDITRFTNRLHMELRKWFKFDKIRFLIVSEYGTDPRFTRRPHYHGLIFGLPLDLNSFDELGTFEECLITAWSVNGVPLARIFDWSVARNSIATCQYCTKYILKQSVDSVPEGKNANFIRMPHCGGCLGTDYFKSHMFEFLNGIYTTGTVTVKTPDNLFTISIPSIFRKKLTTRFSSVFDKEFKITLVSFYHRYIHNRFSEDDTVRASRYLADFPFIKSLYDQFSQDYLLDHDDEIVCDDGLILDLPLPFSYFNERLEKFFDFFSISFINSIFADICRQSAIVYLSPHYNLSYEPKFDKELSSVS